ncbi:MAG TPA: hypothetical protein VGG33_14325 [Polyangia bacterium]
MSLSVFLWFAQSPEGDERLAPHAGQGQAPAQTASVIRTTMPTAMRAPTPEDLREPYAGLSLSPQAKNPLPPPKEDPPSLIWTGFTPGQNGSGGEIFLQTTRHIEHDISVAKAAPGQSALLVVLRNCRIHARNNARRIDTTFFATPVNGVVARQRKRDVELRISLKQAVAPQVRTQPGADGSELIVLSFPPTTEAVPVGPAAVAR